MKNWYDVVPRKDDRGCVFLTCPHDLPPLIPTMSCFAPALRPFLLLISAFLVSSIGNLAVAEESAVAKKSATTLKSGANKPWQVFLTVQRNRQTLKPIVNPLGQDTLGSVMPSLFADQPASTDSMGTSSYFALPSIAPSTPTTFGSVPGRTPLSFAPVGLSGDNTPMLGILDSAPPLPTILGSTILGDTTGNGEIDFVDRNHSLIQIESSSNATQFGGSN